MCPRRYPIIVPEWRSLFRAEPDELACRGVVHLPIAGCPCSIGLVCCHRAPATLRHPLPAAMRPPVSCQRTRIVPVPPTRFHPTPSEVFRPQPNMTVDFPAHGRLRPQQFSFACQVEHTPCVRSCKNAPATSGPRWTLLPIN